MSDCATATCTVASVGRVVTDFQPGEQWDGVPRRIPFPRGVWFTSESLAMILGITRDYMWKLAQLHKDKLGPPHYRVGWKNPIRPRLERLYSEADYDFLRTCFTVIVGRPTKGMLPSPSFAAKRRNRAARKLAMEQSCSLSYTVPPPEAML